MPYAVPVFDLQQARLRKFALLSKFIGKRMLGPFKKIFNDCRAGF